jgi:hypothetical protein
MSEALTSGLRSTADATAVNYLVMTTPGVLLPRRVLIVAQRLAVARSGEKPAAEPAPVVAL